MKEFNGNDKNLVILSTSYWHSPLKFRRHQWALIAAKNGYRVIYVNPTFTIASFFQDEDAKQIFLDFFKKPLEVNNNLTVLTMPPLLPFQRKFLWVDKVNRRITGWILRVKLDKLENSKETTLLVYEPNDIYRTSAFRNALLVYECVDEHSEYPFHHKVKEKIIEIEKRLIKKADILSVSSLFLLEKKKALSRNVVYVPNGVNFELFHAAMKAETSVGEDIAAIPGPVILYVGAIMEWFDYDLVLRIAENKNWSIVLIGPQTLNAHLFRGKSNIHTLGVKEQTQLPNYLKKADVCIIPFLINDLVRGVNPLKLYEYLAAGKPVVSTALPDVISFEKLNYVHIGHDHEEFIKHLDYLIQRRGDPEFMNARAEMAREYAWENNYLKLFNKIETAHSEK